MKYRRFSIILALTVGLLFTWSCEGYTDQFGLDRISTEMEFTPGFAAPIAYGSLSIEDLLEVVNDSSGLIELTDEGLIYVYFKEEAFSLSAGELLKIPDEIGAETFVRSDIDVPGGFEFLPDDTEVSFSKREKMQFYIEPDDRIDSIMLKGGTVNLISYSEFKHTGRLVITSESLIGPNGESYKDSINIDVVDGSFTQNEERDLAGWKIVMTEENDSAFVMIDFELTLIKSPAGISDTEMAGMNLEFKDLEYSAIYGHIASREITDLSQSLDIGFFESLENIPDIYFADPQLNINVVSSFGLPISLDINDFRSRSVVTGEYLDLEFVPGIMPFIVEQPELAGDFKRSVLSLNKETCNIDEILSNVPDLIEFSFAASSGNPEGSTQQNFILDDSELFLEAEVIMPLWFSTSGYTLKDTMDVDLEGILSQIDQIKTISLNLTTTNEWPLELSIQLHVLNSEYDSVGVLFDDKTALLEAAPVDSNGELDRNALTSNPVLIELTEEDFSSLDGAKYIMFEASVLTSDDGNTPVKFYSQYKLDYQLAISADFKLNTSEL